ncbi:rolling circle replication-associated protein [Vibrio diazotrophicus]|uniref:rolling circle replication-associated protein n=1 Tax=Vibrio diazotrophicus TaxID=685 RepID=UPI00142E7EFF|nr:inovirus-type Gp2 protein [Vibrio diazotrophicus]NIY92583.1 inovirus Gp2 family protein [Vibrio diazotrophicus]
MDSLITIHPTHKNVAYITYKNQEQPIFFYAGGLYQNILFSAFEQLDALFSYNNKVTVIFLQLHQPLFSESNKNISMFINKLIRKIKARDYGSRVAYSWAREEGKLGNNLHYHVAIMVNGSLCQSDYYIEKDANEIWCSLGAGCYTWRLKRNTYRLRREGKDHLIRAVRMRLSYAAKKATKDFKQKRKFGCSQLKPRISIPC